jgi:NAD-reducing hydrogenase small subunit
MNKIRLATIWLDGCSGCHMSLLDLDEGLLAVARQADLVYSPLVDASAFPEEVDVTLVEGAVSSQEDAARLQTVRARTRLLVALGDCAVTANVPSMRNTIPVAKLLQSVYGASAPAQGVPTLLPQARPLRDFVKVDVSVPGCPPRPEIILNVLSELLAGRTPKPAGVKFG